MMTGAGGDPPGAPPGWVGMRTVAALRREAGVGPPRERDSLYRPIERPPRRFNPLKVPKSLQVCLTPPTPQTSQSTQCLLECFVI